MRLRLLAAALLLFCGCSRAPNAPEAQRTATEPPKAAPPPSPYDHHFWQWWSDGKAEVCTYNLQGSRQGTAATVVRLDEQRVMHFTLVKRAADVSEMLAASFSLDASSDRPAGAMTEASWSHQDRWGHQWGQIRFGRTQAVAVRQGSTRDDSRQMLDYYAPGFSADGLMIWARRIAWPRVAPGRSVKTHVLDSVSSEWIDNTVHTLARTASSAEVKSADGRAIVTFTVHPALPHYIRQWQTSDGERAVLVNCERVAPAGDRIVRHGP